MNEQLANKIRSQLSGGESYDHLSHQALIFQSKNISSVMFAVRRQCVGKIKLGTKLTAVI
jgi:hypothetical protein